MPKTPKKDRLLIKLSGEGVSPETVPASELAQFLVEFEKAILETALAKKDLSAPEAVQELIVSLVAIESGSESLTFALTGDIMQGASLLSEAHLQHDYSAIPVKAQDALHSISAQAIKNLWSVEFVGDRTHHIRSVVISVDNPVPPPKIVRVQGDTTIYGRLTRVGGVLPRAMIRMPDDTLMFIQLSKDMAVMLASEERLYEEVGIEGTATWQFDTMEMLEFKAKRITTYQPHKQKLSESFKELAEAANDRWNEIDVERFIEELRGKGR